MNTLNRAITMTRLRDTFMYGLFGLFLSLLLSAPALAENSVTTTYYYTDVLGSVVATADEMGNTLTRRTYQPYGAIHQPDPRRRSWKAAPVQEIARTRAHIQVVVRDMLVVMRFDERGRTLPDVPV